MNGPVVLVTSPHSGSARPPAEIAALLHDAGIEIAEILAVDELPREPQGPSWREQGVAAVVAAGGDGTVGAAATHIGDADLALGILPLGTANDSARSLGIPLDLQGAVSVIRRGHAVPIDVGEGVDDQGRRGRFLHAATFGLNAQFARLATDAERRQRLGLLAWPTAAVEAIRTARACASVLRLAHGAVVKGPAMLVAAVNLPHVFGGLPVKVPHVGPRDDKLVFLVMRGLLAVERYEARGARLETERPEVVTLDGEPLLETPVHVHLADRRLQVFLPAGPGEPAAGETAR